MKRYFAKSFFILSALIIWWHGSDTFFLVSLWFLYYQHIINIIMWMIVIEMAIIVVVKLSGLRDSLGFCCLAIFSTRWWGVSYIKFRFKLNIQFGITRCEDCILSYLDLYFFQHIEGFQSALRSGLFTVLEHEISRYIVR